MSCEMCNPPEEYKDWKIKEYDNWIIYIHPNQCYLGRCFIVLKRHLEDFFDVNEKELMEFFEITQKLRNVVSKAFSPDLFNYAFFGNSHSHVHLNFVPRYKTPKTFANMQFEDAQWKYNYSPYNKNFTVSEKVLFDIRDEIKKVLN